MTIKTWEFDSIEERNRFLDDNFRDRIADETIPGLYFLPGRDERSSVGVYMNTVTFHDGYEE